MQCSKAAAQGRKMALLDARKAHLNPKCMEEVYIDLPEESGAGEGVCGKLVHWIYGMRQAAQAWEAMYPERLESVGFVRGVGSAVVFYHNGRDISALVHGDDFVFTAEGEDLDWIQGLVTGWFEMKVRGRLGGDQGDDKVMTILGQTKHIWGS